MPKALAAVLTGAKAGDYRLYAHSAKEQYVVHVVDQLPPATKPYAQVRDVVAKKIYTEKVTKALGEYAQKLRAAQGVEVLIARIGS